MASANKHQPPAQYATRPRKIKKENARYPNTPPIYFIAGFGNVCSRSKDKATIVLNPRGSIWPAPGVNTHSFLPGS